MAIRVDGGHCRSPFRYGRDRSCCAWFECYCSDLKLTCVLLCASAAWYWYQDKKHKALHPPTRFLPKGKVRKVAVIGAGPSGIAAAKEAMAVGMEVTVFEQAGDIGGTWVFREKEGQSSVYRSTFINTRYVLMALLLLTFMYSKQFMTFSDFPMPEALPTYPHHKQIIRYFKDYAKVCPYVTTRR